MVMSSIGLALALASQPALAPVTVEVVAVGHSDTPATKFVLAVEVTATGATDDKAKADLARIKANLVQQLAAVGVTLVPEDPPASHAVKVDLTPDLGVATEDKSAKPSASDSFAVQAADRASVTRAQDIIARTAGASADRPPVSSITDTAAAARAAKRDAIAKAKLDAQNYADALGYGGATVVSVSERGDFGTIFTYMMSTFGSAMSNRTRPNMFEPAHGDTVPMDVAVTVTFRLDGKK